jgi:hypothetical protein
MTDEQVPSADEKRSSFVQQAEEAEPGLVREFLEFLRDNKKWWLIPILIVLALLGLLVYFGNIGAAPFIYPLF